MEVVGKIKVIESVIEKEHKSRNVIKTTDEQYPQHIRFNLYRINATL
jgi:hypothetical protein